MKNLLLRLGFKTEPWPWVRAMLILGVVILAVFIWNPAFTISGIWNTRHAGSIRNRNAASALAIGVALIGCLESVRKRRER